MQDTNENNVLNQIFSVCTLFFVAVVLIFFVMFSNKLIIDYKNDFNSVSSQSSECTFESEHYIEITVDGAVKQSKNYTLCINDNYNSLFELIKNDNNFLNEDLSSFDLNALVSKVNCNVFIPTKT